MLTWATPTRTTTVYVPEASKDIDEQLPNEI